MLRNNQLVGFGAGNGIYTANAWSFGGADSVGSNTVTGNTDSYVGSISLWFRKDGGDGSSMFLAVMGGTQVRIDTSNKMHITTRDGALNILTDTDSVGAYTATSAWHHLATSWDTNHAAGAKLSQLYIDGANVLNAIADVSAAAQVGNTTGFSTHSVLAGSDPSSPSFNGSLAEVYMQQASRIDFSVAANLQKFRSAAGKPVSLGPTGALPTGVAPIIYFKNPIATITHNSGSGGDFSTVNGTPIVASSHP